MEAMSTPAREPEFLTASEAAALVGLSTRAIYRAVQRGELEATRLCSRLRIQRSAIDAWVERGRVTPELPMPSPAVAPQGAPVAGSFRRLLAERSARR
jgi:excisionase family DNA binding protein